ncbi:hypothetical protein HA039_18590 [Streptomyces liangshanensis]|uniref:Integral membrane protein n=2 Tax=Streptomyces liangshanensis TaxID=2717324 RepID=A0A6G9H8U7_9ACTN|nr:hypothetical protein HA039_18590 [Streptomyces liangshanensis]
MPSAQYAGSAASVRNSGSESVVRLALKADVILTGANGIGYLALATVLDSVLGVSTSAQLPIGAFLTVYALGVLFVTTRRTISKPAVVAIIVLNLLWTVVSVVVAVTGVFSPTGIGTFWTVAQGLVVGAIAVFQYVGLKRM